MAQKKSFTLEDLIPGGSTFWNYQPAYYHATWWDNQLVEQDVDECRQVNGKTGAKSTLFTLDTINEALGAASLGKCHTLQGAKFPCQETLVLLQVGGSRVLVDWKAGKVVWSQVVEPGSANADWNAVSRCVAYTIGDNLYVTTADGKKIAVSTDGTHNIVYGKSVHRDEFGIHKGTFWSPKGNLLAFYRMDQTDVTDYPQVDITTRCAVLDPDKYPMAGEASHKVTIGVFNPATGHSVYLKAGDPTDRYFTNISWNPDEKTLYVIELNRDQNEAQLVSYDATTGDRLEVLYEEKHPRYVEPMCGLTFLPWDATKCIYQSQRDGYNHLYLIDLSKKVHREGMAFQGGTYVEHRQMRQITNGDFVVLDLKGFNLKERSVLVMSNEKSPIQRNLYAVSVATGKRMALDDGTGYHDVSLSIDGSQALDIYSSPVIARNADLLQTSKNKPLRLMTAADPWKEQFDMPEISCASIKAADGVTDLYYRMVKPVDFDPNKKYPTVIYVYGGPHAHLVDASRNYQARGWEIYMAQKGYVVFILDSRGSENRGLGFENVTFRHLGVEEMADQMKGVEFLMNQPFVDANRMGIHGWSFGGFMTTNLMCTHGDIFKVGVAGGPVIDWQYYEVMYGERYMDTPQANPEGYKGSNLRLKAKDLKGRLQIITGYNDPTCVQQHALSFLRACEDAGTQCDFFTYPGQGHNMVGRDRVHLHQRITQYFEDFLK